jgi:lysophospholipase L1-like esterase
MPDKVPHEKTWPSPRLGSATNAPGPDAAGQRSFQYALQRWYVKLCIPFVSVLLFFGTAELVCRLTDLSAYINADFKFYVRHVDNDIEKDYMVEEALLMWSPKPGYHRDGITINSAGFRDRDYPIVKRPNVFRVLCLGDSSTFGYGVPFSDLYHVKLEAELARRAVGSNICYEVINAGVTGYTTAQCLGVYKHRGRTYQPDVVTLYAGVNDPHRRLCLSDRQIIREDLPVWVRRLTRNWLANLQFYRVMRLLIMGASASGGEKDRTPVPRVSKEEFQSNVLELNRLCRENGSTLVVISPPLNKVAPRIVEQAPRIVEYRQRLHRLCQEHGIILLYVPELTEASEQDNGHYFVDELHPTPAGHELLEQRLYECLNKRGLLPP